MTVRTKYRCLHLALRVTQKIVISKSKRLALNVPLIIYLVILQTTG